MSRVAPIAAPRRSAADYLSGGAGTDDEIKQVEIEENLGRHDLTESERERLEHARKTRH